MTTTAHGSKVHAGHGEPLRRFRQASGMSQQDVAEALAALAWEHLSIHVGVDRQMVSKWERECKRPTRIYRRLLCLLYGVTEFDLGFRRIPTGLRGPVLQLVSCEADTTTPAETPAPSSRNLRLVTSQ